MHGLLHLLIFNILLMLFCSEHRRAGFLMLQHKFIVLFEVFHHSYAINHIQTFCHVKAFANLSVLWDTCSNQTMFYDGWAIVCTGNKRNL